MVGLSRDFNSFRGNISKNANSDTRSVYSIKLAPQIPNVSNLTCLPPPHIKIHQRLQRQESLPREGMSVHEILMDLHAPTESSNLVFEELAQRFQ